MTADTPEAAAGFGEAGSDPADEHATIALPADMAHEATDETVQVLDGIRAAQRTVERAGDAEALERECLVEALPQGRGRPGVRAREPVGELEEAALRQRRVRERVRLGERPADPRARRLGEMPEDIAELVDLAALDEAERAGRFPDRLPQSRAAVDDEEQRPIEAEAALLQVGQQRLAHRRVLGRALPQGQDVLGALCIQAQRQ